MDTLRLFSLHEWSFAWLMHTVRFPTQVGLTAETQYYMTYLLHDTPTLRSRRLSHYTSCTRSQVKIMVRVVV